MPERDADQQAIERVVEALHGSAKYRHVGAALIREVARQERPAHQHERDLVKATKGRLHQIYGAFFDQPPRYDRWLAELAAARDQGADRLRQACAAIMRRHASTRERLPILDRFYADTLACIPPPRAIYDAGCGINPLAIAWMGLPPDCAYRCCDIDAALVEFLNAYFDLIAVDARAELRDVATDPPTDAADLLLALKLLPTLDQVRRDGGIGLLRASPARHAIVSFPARSLGGRDKGMAHGYETRFRATAEAAGRPINLLSFPGEIAFIVER